VNQGSAILGPPCGVMRPTPKFAKYTYHKNYEMPITVARAV